MTHLEAFETAFAICPLIAILRGVRPEEVETIGEALAECGFSLIEVPLNSPNPLESITRLAKRLENRAVVGAGTVLRTIDVAAVRNAGGAMIISPNADARVIAATQAAELVSLPGIATPSEAFAALEAGATALKLFPAEASNPDVLKAMKAVLPGTARIVPVGGIEPAHMEPWVASGAAGFGLGSALFRPGFEVCELKLRALTFMQTLRELRASIASG